MVQKNKPKYLYRLWIEGANIHGACFDKICLDCQTLIEENIKEHGMCIPCEIVIDTSVADDEGINLRLGSSMHPVIFCEECTKTFMEWIAKQPHFTYGKGSVQLWVSPREEE